MGGPRRGRSPRLARGAGEDGPLEPALARSEGRGVRRGRERLPRDGQTYAQENKLKPHLVSGWVILPKESGSFV